MTNDPLSMAKGAPFAPGTVLVGKYRVDRLLGQGGMGWVVVATHLQLEQRVAIKFMHAQNANENPEAVGRFVREARAAARIQSEHVARVSDVGTLENGSPYLVMEYLDGHDLEAELSSSRDLPISLVVDYGMQACEGLAEAHAAGIVHRDLKPGNLFLARRSEGSVRVKLLDFGISKLAPLQGSSPEIAMTSTQTLMGSPLYMSPEQLRSSKNVDRRTDIWSMGVILYEMLSRHAPFNGDTLPEVCARIMVEPPPALRAIRPEVPAALEAVVMRCLEKEPERRFQDVAGLALALAPFGSVEARAGSDRITRLTRASAKSYPDHDLVTTEHPAPAATPPQSAIAQTNAAFIAAEPTGPPRRPSSRMMAWGAAIMVVAGAVVGVTATLGRRAERTSTVAVPPASAVPIPMPVLPPPASAVLPAPEPPMSAVPSATATARAPVATPMRPQPKVKPVPVGTTAKPVGTTAKPVGTTAKPASTNGFGGRD